MLWAEDGLFTLCNQKADFVSCVVDSLAGYLLVTPRLLAGIVFPIVGLGCGGKCGGCCGCRRDYRAGLLDFTARRHGPGRVCLGRLDSRDDPNCWVPSVAALGERVHIVDVSHCFGAGFFFGTEPMGGVCAAAIDHFDYANDRVVIAAGCFVVVA